MAAINFSFEDLENGADETGWKGVPFPDFAAEVRANVRSSEWLSSVSTTIPDDITPPEYMAFIVLREFLQPNSHMSINEAIQCLVRLFPHGELEDEAFIVVSLDMARQIPYRHSAHQKLARLLWSYGRSTARLDRSAWNSDMVTRFYHIFGSDISYRYLRPNDGDDEYPPDMYVNYLAFVAHVHAVGIFRPWSTLAIHLVASGLESSHETATSTERDAWVLGAAQLILWHGQGLVQLILLPEDLEPDYAVPSWLADEPDYHGPLTRKRWHVWKEAFIGVSESSDYGVECREVAKKAADIMEALETGMLS